MYGRRTLQAARPIILSMGTNWLSVATGALGTAPSSPVLVRHQVAEGSHGEAPHLTRAQIREALNADA